MKRPPRIELASTRADSLRVGQAIAVALASLACGLGVAFALGPRGRHESVPAASAGQAASEPPAREPEKTSPSNQSVAPVPVSSLDPLPPTLRARDEPMLATPANAPSESVALQAPAPPAAPLAAPAAGDDVKPSAKVHAALQSPARNPPREVMPTTIAYLRCDGLERPGARYPCPRDRMFEKRAREVVTALPQCTTAPALDAGEIELRVELSRWGAVSGVELSGSALAASKAALDCMQPALRELSSTLRARRAIVLLRFEVR